MACEMEVTPGGVVKSYQFYPGVIHSHERMTYTKVAAMLEGKEASRPEIDTLYLVFKSLFGARQKRGAIDFESVETQMIFDAQGKIERIVRVVRNDAHRVIEECMLAANVSASDYLEKNQQPTLFRVHEGPTPEKLEALRAMLKDFALTLGGGDKPQAKDYAELLNHIRDKPYAGMLQTVMLRSLHQAVYTPENVGHFGLAYDAYAHFTSPIRRYPDLIVHRRLNELVTSGPLHGERLDRVAREHPVYAMQSSDRERRAEEAEREVLEWKKVIFMRDKVGHKFTGIVTGVMPFGLFIELDEIFVQGLVPIATVGGDYWQYREKEHRLRGESTNRELRLGDHVLVEVKSIDEDRHQIEFRLLELAGSPVATRQQR
jgi:ribonuclease R